MASQRCRRVSLRRRLASRLYNYLSRIIYVYQNHLSVGFENDRHYQNCYRQDCVWWCCYQRVLGYYRQNRNQ